MQKTLTPVGNSLALVIEKPVRKLLGITRKTVLEVSTDGRKLVIEPVSAARIAAARPEGELEQDAPRVFLVLRQHHHMTEDELAKLYEGRRFAHYMLRMLGTPIGELDEPERRTMRRMRECLRALEVGKSSEEALAAALAAVPKA